MTQPNSEKQSFLKFHAISLNFLNNLHVQLNIGLLLRLSINYLVSQNFKQSDDSHRFACVYNHEGQGKEIVAGASGYDYSEFLDMLTGKKLF